MSSHLDFAALVSSEFSESQISFLKALNDLTIALSMMAFFIYYFIVVLRSKEKLTFPVKLISNLFFADFTYTLSNILSDFSATNQVACQIEGFFKTFSLWSSVLWATIIGFVAYQRTINNSLTIDRKYGLFFAIAYGWPFLFGIMPYIPNISFFYQSNGSICWIATDNDYTILTKWLFFFGWVWIIIIISTILYVRLFLYMRSLDIDTSVIEYRGILIYPLLLYVALIPITLSNTGLIEKYPFALTMTELLTLHPIGFINILAYGYQKIRATANEQKVLKEELLNSADQPKKEGSQIKHILEFVEETQTSRTANNSSQNQESLEIVLGEFAL